jgi:hypothetical protein
VVSVEMKHGNMDVMMLTCVEVCATVRIFLSLLYGRLL